MSRVETSDRIAYRIGGDDSDAPVINEKRILVDFFFTIIAYRLFCRKFSFSFICFSFFTTTRPEFEMERLGITQTVVLPSFFYEQQSYPNGTDIGRIYNMDKRYIKK